MPTQEKQEERALAQRYREAASQDAYHERGNGAAVDGGQDMTIALTPETPNVPMRDVAHPDAADGEDHDAPPSPKGPAYDALMRGLEPGETSMG